MYCKPVLDYFLGALSPAGFTGWFSEAAGEDGLTAYLIKAGPGCGKSTFMRQLAERDAAVGGRDGNFIERIHCSSDPASLDGVLLSDVGALVLDATAPHTLDCKYPGAAERVLSFYDTLDTPYLARNRAEVLRLGSANTGLLQRAASHYALACALLRRRRTLAAEALDRQKLQRFTARLAARTMPARRGAKAGAQRHRLLSAPTPGGVTVFYDTIPALAERSLYAIHDPYGAASGAMLKQLAEHARANGYGAVLCHCPTDQAGRLDHLFVPALGLGFVSCNPWHAVRLEGQHNLHASRFMDPDALQARRRLMRYQKRLADGLIARTCEAQSEAKQVHDELEKFYVKATDFAAVDRLRSRLEDELFGG